MVVYVRLKPYNIILYDRYISLYTAFLVDYVRVCATEEEEG